MAEVFDEAGHDTVAGDPDLLATLDELTDTIERAKSMPLSSSALISREEVLELLSEAQAAVPAELQRARQVLREHEELRARAAHEAGELLDAARAQAAHLVQRTEVVRQARHEAERLILDAESDARRIRHEAEDYVDRKLAAFEIVLDRTIRTVQAGRERLSSLPTAGEADGADGTDDTEAPLGADFGPFDQDTR